MQSVPTLPPPGRMYHVPRGRIAFTVGWNLPFSCGRTTRQTAPITRRRHSVLASLSSSKGMLVTVSSLRTMSRVRRQVPAAAKARTLSSRKMRSCSSSDRSPNGQRWRTQLAFICGARSAGTATGGAGNGGGAGGGNGSGSAEASAFARSHMYVISFTLRSLMKASFILPTSSSSSLSVKVVSSTSSMWWMHMVPCIICVSTPCRCTMLP